jgi:transcriptional regulator with XRE-family HTH domain
VFSIVLDRSHGANSCVKINVMPDNSVNSAATSFGQQMKKMRLARHWTLREMAARTGVNFTALSRVERGERPPTEALARACDANFPELPDNWFLDFYAASRTWAPPGFIDWGEYEDSAAELHVWAPGIVSGISQVEGYARAMLAIHPGATADQIEARLKGRMARQRKIFRDEGPAVTLLVDMASLYRAVGSAEVMAAQCARLAELAERPNVTLQVVPPVAIPLANASVMITETAAYTEHALAGAVYMDGQTVRWLRRLLDSVRAQARPASETPVILRRAETSWNGVSRPTAATAARTA